MKQLCFELRSWWHAGAGRGTGQLLDAAVVKRNGLPILPGRTVKGLVRDAVMKAEDWGHLPEDTCETLFGTSTLLYKVHPSDTEPGLLTFGDATLPGDLSRWLATQRESYREALFGELHATAIDPQSGRAKPQSLRGMEVTVPLKLYAPVTTPVPADTSWCDALNKALPLIRGLGQSRHRGLGRVQVTLEEVQNAS